MVLRLNRQEPLGLPRGSVRAVLTLVLVLAAVATLFIPVVDDRAMGMLLAFVGVAVQSYFRQREERNREEEPAPETPRGWDEE